MKVSCILALICVLVLTVGCLPPSQEDIARAIQQTQAAEITNIPRPTITPQSTKPICQLTEKIHEDWTIVLCDSFTNNENNWWVGTDAELGMIANVLNGKYIIEYNSKNQTGYTTGMHVVSSFFESDDYAYHFTGRISSKFRNCTWGVVVRGTIDDGYEFAIDNVGNYYLTKMGLGGYNNYIGNIKHGASSAIKWGEFNTITALVEGEEMAFFVNGAPIVSHKASDSTKKNIGHSVWAAEGVTATYQFDDILIREK